MLIVPYRGCKAAHFFFFKQGEEIKEILTILTFKQLKKKSKMKVEQLVL